MGNRVLIVVDDQSVRQALAESLGPDLQVVAAENGDQALAILVNSAPDVILTDALRGEPRLRAVLQRVGLTDPYPNGPPSPR